MTNKPKKQILTTPKGIAQYPHLREPDIYNDKIIGYTIQLYLNKKDTEELEAFLNKTLQDAKKQPEFKGKVWSNEPYTGIKVDKNGDKYFKFKTATSFTRKDGTVIERIVSIYKPNGDKYDLTEDIGSGSTVQVAYTINPYHMSKINNGLALYLEAVMVHDKKEFGEVGASTFGFEINHDDFEADFKDDEDAPF